MLNHLIFLLFSFFLYKYVYELLPGVSAKLPFANAVWSMAMYFGIFWLGLRNIEKIFRTDIQSGNIEIYLLRPMNYIQQKVLTQIGLGLFPFVTAMLLSAGVNYFLIGIPVVGMSFAPWLLALVIILVLSQILTACLYVLCGLSGFWLEDSAPVYLVVSKLIMVFGGSWVPVAFFPQWLRLIAEFSPFGASVGISYAMYPDFADRFAVIVMSTVFWIIVSAALMYVVAKRAERNLTVNG